MPKLIRRLIERGFSDENIEKPARELDANF
jgi:hypothetical protein